MSEKMMDVERARVVDAMCMTWRHDFGLNKQADWVGSSGMTDDERDALRRRMGQLYDHHFAQARASQPVGVPDGYALVPVEPTPEMLEAAWIYHGSPAYTSEMRPDSLTDAECYRAMLAAAPTVKAEQGQCEVCHGQGEVYSGHDQNFPYFDFQPPEPIMDVCPECGGEEAPSLPAAGSAVEELDVVARSFKCADKIRLSATDLLPKTDGYIDLMTVAQHKRIVAALSVQHPAPERVSVPVELLERATEALRHKATFSDQDFAELRALLSGAMEGGV